MSRRKQNRRSKLLLANFTQTFDPQGVWIGLIIDSGEKTYTKWSEQMDNCLKFLRATQIV